MPLNQSLIMTGSAVKLGVFDSTRNAIPFGMGFLDRCFDSYSHNVAVFPDNIMLSTTDPTNCKLEIGQTAILFLKACSGRRNRCSQQAACRGPSRVEQVRECSCGSETPGITWLTESET